MTRDTVSSHPSINARTSFRVKILYLSFFFLSFRSVRLLPLSLGPLGGSSSPLPTRLLHLSSPYRSRDILFYFECSFIS